MKSDAKLVELIRTEIEPFVSAIPQNRVHNLAFRHHTRDATGQASVSAWHVLTLRDARQLRDNLDKLLSEADRSQEPAESAF